MVDGGWMMEHAVEAVDVLCFWCSCFLGQRLLGCRTKATNILVIGLRMEVEIRDSGLRALVLVWCLVW